MSKVKEVLIEARGLIEKGWTQYVIARNSEGESVPADHPSATCLCAIGAIYMACRKEPEKSDEELYSDVIRSFKKSIGNNKVDCVVDYIADWNDAHGRTKEEVLAMFDRAIESLS